LTLALFVPHLRAVDDRVSATDRICCRPPHGDALRNGQPRARSQRLLRTYRRHMPNFLVGWPTWFRNRCGNTPSGVGHRVEVLEGTEDT